MTLQALQDGTIALVFPGQGSQAVGMGKNLVDTSAAAKAAMEEADATLGVALTDLCFNGPAGDLEDTWNAQPAILAVSIAALRAIDERAASEGVRYAPLVTAGHSLGQFTAMVAADVLAYPDALRLVRERGRLMKEAGEQRPGGMAAVLGLDEDKLVAICEEASAAGVINVANANCPGQIVISGEVPALEQAMDRAKAAGAKRVARLGVSIASHSPLMADVSRQLGEIVAGMTLHDPAYPIVGNVSGEAITTAAALRDELAHHVERPVNWTKSVQTMIGMGADTFVEIGAGAVLGGLIKRIDRNVRNLTTADILTP